MQGQQEEQRHQELIKKKKELEKKRPHGTDEIRRSKHDMGQILTELEH